MYIFSTEGWTLNNGVNDTGAKEEKIQHRMFVHISPIYCITKTDIISVVNVTGR